MAGFYAFFDKVKNYTFAPGAAAGFGADEDFGAQSLLITSFVVSPAVT